MYLESIDIQGFKSFADPTTLVFNKELTAIVGPNGSGKSNIADAIRWVLGEQSMKLLRGKKSHDVIFAGSDKKGRLGFAKVSMRLDNSDHKADIDYDTIVIERSMDRNGESEYFLNNNKTRLTDIQLLLARASVGQKSYSVVGQGTIDNLLSLSAQERRDFFDEATGVRQFQIKKGQALNKLEQTEENLEQAELVLQEIEPRLRTLTRQVKRLERKEDLEKQLIESQNTYYSFLLGNLNGDLAKSRGKEQAETALLKKLSDEQRSIQTTLDSLDREQGRGDAYNTLQKKLFNVQQEYNALTKKKIILEGQKDLDRIKSGDSATVILNQRQTELTNKINALRTEIGEREAEMPRTKSLVNQLEKKVVESSAHLEELEHVLSTPEDADQETLKNLARELNLEHEQILSDLEAVVSTDEIASFKMRFKPFAAKLRNFLSNVHSTRQKDAAKHRQSFSVLHREYKELDQELRNAELALGRKEHELAIVKEKLAETEKELREIERRLSDNTGQSAAGELTEIDEELSIKERSIKGLRDEIDHFNEREEGKKKELIDLQKKFRTIQHDLTIKNNELTSLKIELAKLETRKEDLEQEIAQEAPRFTMQEIGRVNEQEEHEKIETLKRQLNIIGGIDTDTVKEYEEVKGKYEFLSQQTTDLRDAQKSLISLIMELDEHITKQFELSFKNINTQFGKYFKQLFDGGNAKLTLNMIQTDGADEDDETMTDDDDDEDKEKKIPVKKQNPITKLKGQHFDYSIDIQATPPGKKLSGINMLSGGEKALSAIALICAIIANNPPPFVVLDEVDAALDEANSIRFAEIISELLDKSQFITITHNRATMHQAKILYGVTMGDDGISRLLSVNFNEADKMSA